MVSGHPGKCKNLHGHNYRIHFHCEGEVVDGMVIDFGDIKTFLCWWLEDNWDHRFLVWNKDPIYDDLKKIDSQVRGVPFNPTAENMAQYLLDVVGPSELPDGIRLAKVIVEETRKCSVEVELQE
jgi:6-pyruvoyltetrahydropterin/6-carboxytetrahydropterin synthase